MPEEPKPDADPAKRLRLREKPRPVLRLSRKILIALAGTGCAGLAAALAVAVAPAKPKPVTAPAVEASRRTPVSTEALGALPKDYTDIPKLGPPLPGDLGRPLLAAQTADAAEPYAALPNYADPVPSLNDAASQAKATAITSQLFFAQTAGTPASPASIASADPAAAVSGWTMPGPAISGLAITGAAQDQKRSFLDQISNVQPVSAQRLTDPVSPYMLLTGSVIPAALITGIRSEIPGQVLAQVTQDVRDTVSGRYLLIPRGSRLIGQYDNAISFGQSRLLLVWSRLILPDGRSIILEKLSAADAGGYAGLQDRTDNHWASIAGAAALSTILAVGAESGDADSDGALIRAIRNGGADAMSKAGQQVVERQLNVQPTLTIRPGLPVRVILSRDLVLEPYGE